MTEENYDDNKVVEISKIRLNNVYLYLKIIQIMLMIFIVEYENQFIDPTFQSLVITAPQKSIEDNSTIFTKIKIQLLNKYILVIYLKYYS